MFRQAWSEVRHHPGRFLSTIIAIAISVAFLAGSAVLVATEGQAQGKAMNVSLAEADVVVTIPPEGSGKGLGPAIAAVAGVATSVPVYTMSDVVTSGAISEAISFVNVPPDGLRWASLTAGRWPSAANEVVLSGGAAGALGLRVGDPLTLAGRSDSVQVVGLTNEPSGLFVKTGYASDARFVASGYTADNAQEWAVKAAPGISVADLIDTLEAKLTAIAPTVKVASAAEVRAMVARRWPGL